MSSMSYNSASGLTGMLKAGHEHHFDDDNGSGTVVARNISAACELSQMLRSSMGPQGRCKLVVNHLEKIIVTSDCASILKEIHVQHPAAKLLELAVQQQEAECGDATNLALMFAGELLQQTKDLMRMMGGYKHATDIWMGYTMAFEKLQSILESQVVVAVPNPVVLARKQDNGDAELLTQLSLVLHPVLGSKIYGTEETLAKLLAQACKIVLQHSANNNNNNNNNNSKETTKAGVLQPEHVRVVKILGGQLNQSECIAGFVTQRGVETTKTQSEPNAKIAVFACGLEASSTEAKGTVLMKNAQDLKTYNKTEEAKMEEAIQAIAASGAQVLVTGGSISDMALHFINKYNLIALKIGSKWELRRLCQATGSTALVRFGPPTPEELGSATVEQRMVSGTTVTVLDQSHASTADSANTTTIATLVLRASTSSVLQDLERAVEDGVHAIQMACKDGRLVCGGGATEMECSVQLDAFADEHPGLEQYAIRAFAKSLECVAYTLAENAGWDATSVVADLRAAHVQGQVHAGVQVNMESTTTTTSSTLEEKEEPSAIANMKEKEIYDLFITKQSALRLAVEAAMTVLKVDQLIMSKPSGGPKM